MQATINIVISKSVYYISATVYFSNYIYTNLIHVTTKTTRSIMATVLEQALTAIYDVLSVKVNKIIIENISKLYVDSQKDSIICNTFDIYIRKNKPNSARIKFYKPTIFCVAFNGIRTPTTPIATLQAQKTT